MCEAFARRLIERHLKPRPHRRGFFMRATNASGADGFPRPVPLPALVATEGVIVNR